MSYHSSESFFHKWCCRRITIIRMEETCIIKQISFASKIIWIHIHVFTCTASMLWLIRITSKSFCAVMDFDLFDKVLFWIVCYLFISRTIFNYYQNKFLIRIYWPSILLKLRKVEILSDYTCWLYDVNRGLSHFILSRIYYLDNCIQTELHVFISLKKHFVL